MNRLQELLALREKGMISATELEELSALQKEAKENPQMTMSKKDLETAVAIAVEPMKEKAAKLEKDLEELREKAARKSIYDMKNDDNKTLQKKKLLGKYFKAVALKSTAMMKELVEAGVVKAMNETTDSDGGYLLQEEFEAGLIYEFDTFGIARRNTSIVNMGTRDSRKPIGINSVAVYWLGESEKKTSSKATFGNRALKAKKLAAIVPWTDELAEDSELDVFNIIVSFASERFQEAEDIALFQGNGAAGDLEILGIFNTVGVLTEATSGATLSTLNSDFLTNVQHAAESKYKKRAPKWYMHESILAVIEKLKDDEGRPLYRTLNDSTSGMLLGRPVELSSSMPNATDVDAGGSATPFLVYGDLSYVSFGRRSDIATKLLTEATITDDDGTTVINLAEQDMSALRLVQRIDIVVDIPEALTLGILG